MSVEEYQDANEPVESSDTENREESQTQELSPEESVSPDLEQETKDTSSEVPFHEHPRFKELIESKNSLEESNKYYQSQLTDLQSQFEQIKNSQPKTETQDELVARLKSVDPEFGDRFEQLSSLPKELEEFREWKQQQEVQAIQRQAETKISDLHSQFKVPKELQVRYEREIRAVAAENPKLNLGDLDTVYKQVHEEYTKLLDGIRRDQTKQYVQEKSTDSKVPTSQPKGQPAKARVKSTSISDPEMWRASIAKAAVKSYKADSDI